METSFRSPLFCDGRSAAEAQELAGSGRGTLPPRAQPPLLPRGPPRAGDGRTLAHARRAEARALTPPRPEGPRPRIGPEREQPTAPHKGRKRARSASTHFRYSRRWAGDSPRSSRGPREVARVGRVGARAPSAAAAGSGELAGAVALPVAPHGGRGPAHLE